MADVPIVSVNVRFGVGGIWHKRVNQRKA